MGSVSGPGRPPGDPHFLENGMEAHSSILARRNPRTEEPGKLQPLELKKCQTRLSK